MSNRTTAERRGLALLATIALAALVAACDLLPLATPTVRQQRARELAANEAAWAATGVSSYSFTVSRSCFCPIAEPTEVTVEDGRPVTITRGGLPIDASQVSSLPLTVPSLFEVVRSQLDAHSLEVAYDPVTGVPMSIVVDPIQNAVDEEFSIQVTDYRPRA